MNTPNKIFINNTYKFLLIFIIIIAFSLHSKANHFKSNTYSSLILYDSILPQVSKKSIRQIKKTSKLIPGVTNAESFTISYNNSIFQVVVVNSKYNDLKIIPNTTGSMQGLDYHISQNPKAKILMNAGMFELNGAPVGLLISGQKQIKKINLKRGLPGNFYSMKNGVFYVDIEGKYYVKNTFDFNEKHKEKYSEILYATQSGPVLTIDGKINKEFNINSTNKLIRNGIGVFNNSKNNIAVLIISQNPCTFFDLASLFKYLGCDNSMFLDGTVSRLYYKKSNIKTEKPITGDMKLGPIFSISPKN
jgi:uncharacterized protein YigE (DUF2233 family)